MKSGRLAVSALNNSISNEGENIKLNLGTKQEMVTAEKRIKVLEQINQSLREQIRLTPEGKADPGTLRRVAKHLMQEYGGSWSQKEMEAKLQEIYQVQKEHRPQAAQEKTQRLASELVRNYLDKDNPDAETIRENKKPPGRAESFPFMTTEKVLRNKSMTGRQGKYRKRIRCLLGKHHSYIKTLGLMLCR